MSNIDTLGIVKGTITENEYSGKYLIENTKNGEKKIFDAREKADAISKAIDNPQLGFIATLIKPSYEDYRVAMLQELGEGKEDSENDFFVTQGRKVEELGNTIIKNMENKHELSLYEKAEQMVGYAEWNKLDAQQKAEVAARLFVDDKMADGGEVSNIHVEVDIDGVLAEVLYATALGYNACFNGEPVESNPYADNAEQHDLFLQWNRGYMQCDFDNEEYDTKKVDMAVEAAAGGDVKKEAELVDFDSMYDGKVKAYKSLLQPGLYYYVSGEKEPWIVMCEMKGFPPAGTSEEEFVNYDEAMAVAKDFAEIQDIEEATYAKGGMFWVKDAIKNKGSLRKRAKKEAVVHEEKMPEPVKISHSVETLREFADGGEVNESNQDEFNNRIQPLLYIKAYNKDGIQTTTLNDVSLNEAEKIAEPIRIANPDSCVNITSPAGDFVCHVTWNMQMDEFPEYEVFTEEGKNLKAASSFKVYHELSAPEVVPEKIIVAYKLKGDKDRTKEFADKEKAETFIEMMKEDEDIDYVNVVTPKVEEVTGEIIPAELVETNNILTKAEDIAKVKAGIAPECIYVGGVSSDIDRYEELQSVIENAKAEQDAIADKLKITGKEKFIELYKQKHTNPGAVLLKDGQDDILFIVLDEYNKVEPEKEDALKKHDLVETKTCYSFNPEILDRIGDIVNRVLQDSKLISEEDKENIIIETNEVSVKKGTIDRLLDYENQELILSLVEPILALKVMGL